MGEELITQYGPVGGVAIALLLLIWRELTTVKDAPKTDRALEDAFRNFSELLKGQGEQFVANMVLFRETNQRTEHIEGLLGAANALLQQILTELARGRR